MEMCREVKAKVASTVSNPLVEVSPRSLVSSLKATDDSESLVLVTQSCLTYHVITVYTLRLVWHTELMRLGMLINVNHSFVQRSVHSSFEWTETIVDGWWMDIKMKE